MAGALLAMPMLLINMGGEMVYILDQRLKAQNVPEDKSKKVLCDVLKTMYSPRFIQEVFKPTEMYSSLSTRQIFDRLAHSSIMKLNESSMDKLYDLMSMGFKYQITCCSSADMLLSVCINHLKNLKEMVKGTTAEPLIEEATLLTTTTYGTMSNGNFCLLRQSLLRFFQDKKVKVSLFLQNQMQNMDGTLILRGDGVMATGANIPGIIRYFDENEKEIRVLNFEIDSSDNVIDPGNSSILERNSKYCTYGENLYVVDKKKNVQSDVTNPVNSSERIQSGSKLTTNGSMKEISTNDKGKMSPNKKIHQASAKDGLNLLADLIGSYNQSGAKDEGDKDTGKYPKFKINLFNDDPMDSDKDMDESYVPTINIDAASDHKSINNRIKELNFDDIKTTNYKSQDKKMDSDDLLSLMDSTI